MSADELSSVTFELQNPEGTDETFDLFTPILGDDLFVLIEPGDEGPIVRSSHLDFDDLAEVLGLVLAVLVRHGEIKDETIGDAIGLLLSAMEER